MNIKGEGHSLTLVQGRSDSQHFQTKFHMGPPWDGGTKFIQMVQVTWPIWLPCSYMVITLKLLWNQMADDLESWYAASGTWVLPSLFKWWPWVDLDLFTARSNLVPCAFVWEKGKTMDFSEIIVMSTNGQGHSVTLVQISQIQYF